MAWRAHLGYRARGWAERLLRSFLPQAVRSLRRFPMSFSIGATIVGKYRIERVLGQGGMGTVFLAQHLLLERPVALKLLRADSSEHPGATERLLREGRALARLRGNHIARVLDVEAPDNGPCFLVLEYLEGEDLSALLDRSGLLPVNQALSYVLQACEGLLEAHAYGIVHRDIKPSNLFVTTMPDGTQGLKVIDFGISKDTVVSSALTQSHSMIGSPCYMAPEQMRAGANVDARADIWSLGVVLYELLTGNLPHQGASMLEICACILESAPKSPKSQRPELPDAVDAAVRKCLARDPAERFTSVSELARAIAQYSGTSTERLAWILPSELDEARSRVRDSDRKSSVPSQGIRTQQDEQPGKRRLSPRLALLVAILFAFGVLGFFGAKRRPTATAASAAATQASVAVERVLTAPSAASAATVPASAPSVQPVLPSTPAPRVTARRVGVRPVAANPSSLPTSQIHETASGVHADPVLQYGHY